MNNFIIQMNWSPYTTYYLNKSNKPGNRQCRVSQPVYYFSKSYREESACPMPHEYTAYLHARNFPVFIKRGKMPKNEMSSEDKIAEKGIALGRVDASNQKMIGQLNSKSEQLYSEKTGYKETLKTLNAEEGDLLLGKTSSVWTKEEFLNHMGNVGNIAQNARDEVLLDEVVRLVFLNLTIKDGKVASHQLNPVMERLLKPTSILLSRSDRT